MKKFIVLLFVGVCTNSVFGQSLDTPRIEVGPIIGATTFGTAISTQDTRSAYGGRIVLNLHRRIALEYQMAYFPSSISSPATQGSGHLKWKIWEENHGSLNIFAVLGPGFLREDHEYIGGGIPLVDEFRSIAVDYGAGIEVVPHRRFSLRLDLTDFYAGKKFAGTLRRSWAHHMDLKAAVMFRF